MNFQKFSEKSQFIKQVQESVPFSEIINKMINQKKAMLFTLDWNEDFYRDLNTHEDIIMCQETYLEYYLKNYPEMLVEEKDEDL